MFVKLATEYAQACLQRRYLRRQMPQCEFYLQWRADLRSDVYPNELQRPCYMDKYWQDGHLDVLPTEERCEQCQKRAELEPQIKALTYKMRGLKQRMLRAYEKENQRVTTQQES